MVGGLEHLAGGRTARTDQFDLWFEGVLGLLAIPIVAAGEHS